MTSPPPEPGPAAAEPSMRGRFAIYPQDKGAVIGYATGLCETCLHCGCGTSQEPLDLTPSGVMGLMGKFKGLKGMIRL